MTQLSLLAADGRTRAVNLRAEAYDVYAGRPRGGRDPREVPIGEHGWLGNPFDVRVHGHGAFTRYREYFLDRVREDRAFRAAVLELKSKRLGCFCKPGPCHADTIAEWVDAHGRMP